MVEDTVYAVLYRPGECFRCEAAIPAFYEKLKLNNPQNKMLLITVYEDSCTSCWYNAKNNYIADYHLYDTKDLYKNIFSFNSEGMYGLYLLKLLPKEGIFVTGGQYTVLGKEFICQLIKCNKRIPPHIYELDKTESNREMADSFRNDDLQITNYKQKDIEVLPHDSITISTLYDIPKLENGYLFFNDMLNNGIMLYKQERGAFHFKTVFQASDTEMTKFVSVSDEHFKKLERQGQVFYIALSANLIDSTHIGISYSLPKIFEEKNNNELHFSFYNAPAILVRNITDYSPGGMIALDFDLEHSKYFYLHFVFDLYNSKIWTGCEKLTWPMDGFEKDDIEGDDELNPFTEGFYNTSNPIIAAFNIKDGKCCGQYGKLEDIQRRSKTGYYYLNNVFAHEGKDFLYGNGYTGKLYLTDSITMSIKNVYSVFDVDNQMLQLPDSTKFYTHEYGNLYCSNFSRCITFVKMDKQKIYCLVKHGMPRIDDYKKDRYSFVVISRKNGKVKEYPLPNVTKEYKCLGYGISTQDGKFSPFVFLKKRDKYLIRKYEI
ncbi:MAG: hypothetical protein ACI4A7_00090 [Prevotella sp.]